MDIKQQAKQDYLDGMAMADIAIKYGKSAGTIRSWKSRDQWGKEVASADKAPTTDKKPKKKVTKKRNATDATLQQKSATQHENVATLDEDELDADGLTTKQAQFAYLVANGMSKSGAYREAYDVERMSDNSIWSKASELSKNGKVTVRIKQIQQELLELSGWSRERSYSEKSNFLEQVKQTFEKDGRIGQGTATAFMSVVSDLDNMLESDIKRKQRAEADMAEYQRDYITGADVVEDDGGASLIEAIEGSGVNAIDETAETENEV